jgi:hypothetical protein
LLPCFIFGIAIGFVVFFVIGTPVLTLVWILANEFKLLCPPPEECIGPVVGMGIGLTIVLAIIIYVPRVVRKHRTLQVWGPALMVVMGAVVGGSLGAYDVAADYHGPDGAGRITVKMKYSNRILWSYFSGRTPEFECYLEVCVATALGIAIGITIGWLFHL